MNDDGTLNILDGTGRRTAYKAEGILLDPQGPAAYIPRYHSDGRKYTIDECRRSVMQESGERMRTYLRNVPVIKVENVTLTELEGRTNNAPKDREAAQKRMEEIEKKIAHKSQDIYWGSTKVVDREGTLLIAVMSHRCKDMKKKVDEGLSLTYRSENCFRAFLKEKTDSEMIYDGIPSHSLQYIAVNTQSYIGVHGVSQCATDIRHDKRSENSNRFISHHYCGEDKEYFLFSSTTPPQQATPIASLGRHQTIAKLRQQAADGKRTRPTGSDSIEKWYWEHVGVKHVDRMWPEQGKEVSKDSTPSRSSDLFKGPCYHVDSSKRFCVIVNQYVQELLLPAVIATMPREYEECYRRTYLAAALDESEERRPGFHTGHAIVWKNVVHQHMDGGDSGFCITFCTGSFRGGYLVFPDLGLVFRYRPGDVVIFRSKALYHGVTTWIPIGDIDESGVTPGRVAHVLYTKSNAVAKAKRRFPGWARVTNIGREPDIWRDRQPEDFPIGKKGILGTLRTDAFRRISEKRVTISVTLPGKTRRNLDQLVGDLPDRPKKRVRFS